MELKHVLLTILKIVISTWYVLQLVGYVECEVLMGGHRHNENHSDVETSYEEYDYFDRTDLPKIEKAQQNNSKANLEEIPNPSPLVLPGYNLPENIFNRGKPFYAEKDPLTGKVDLNNKSPFLESNNGDLYEYVYKEPSDDIYNKKNIDRKDGDISSYGSHKQADVNQLTPNFHDFLNLPVKYNPNKYVYPLISSSYASTKIQGSVNKFHNHKDSFGVQKTSTQKSVSNPSEYYSSSSYYTPRTTQRTMATTPVTLITTTKPTTIKRYPELTTVPINILNSGMSHPSFGEEYEYDDNSAESSSSKITTTAKKSIVEDIYLTTQNVKDLYLTTKLTTTTQSTTTKRVLSLFEQLFGDYDETVTTTEVAKASTKPLPTQELITTISPITISSTSTVRAYYPNIHAGPQANVLTSSNMEMENSYEYVDEDYSDESVQDSIPVANKINIKKEDNLSVEPLNAVTKLNPINYTIYEDKFKNEKKSTVELNQNKLFNAMSNKEQENVSFVGTTPNKTVTSATPTTYRPTTLTTIKTTSRVTSLPLGDNHINGPSFNPDPIIVATQNLREKLNSEKVELSEHQLTAVLSPHQQNYQKPITQLAPSSSNIHIAPGQDTASFVIGHHQSVGDGGQYVGTALKESPFENKPFKPFYGQETTYSNNFKHNNNNNNRPHINLKPLQTQDLAGSTVTIQPLQNSEASLAIGRPVNGIKQVPGKVIDATLDNDRHVNYSITKGNKVVFPDDKKPVISNFIPPKLGPHHTQLGQSLNKEVLKLNSKPMYHQLPSDLTPPRENDIVAFPSQLTASERPIRPPWDPRPGHFHSGKPEYVRPPRPPSSAPYKRIDNLPNILPQFRPNTKYHYNIGPPPYHVDQRLNRQPLLERPSNRPIGFFEKMGSPPHGLNPYKRYPPKNILRGHPPNLEERRVLSADMEIEKRRRLVQQPSQSLDDHQTPIAEDRIINEDLRKPQFVNTNSEPELNMYQTPPKIHIANRKKGDGDIAVETLQMIQAKSEKEKGSEKNGDENEEEVKNNTVRINAQDPDKSATTDKLIYKVYPINTVPIIDVDKTDDALSIRPNEFIYQHQDRNDSPILKPHPRPAVFPAKSDFPYPLERPDAMKNQDSSSVKLNNLNQDPYDYSNQWNTVSDTELRIVSGGKINYSLNNKISATLKTYTEKPIAIAYTPTEPSLNVDKYSMPNYGSPVIPEIRPGTVDNAETEYGGKNTEFTVHATMHTNPHIRIPTKTSSFHDPNSNKFNHKIDADVDAISLPPQLDFQAPFQASVNLDTGANQGWSVVKDKNRTGSAEEAETTTMPLATTSEFDFENFKPQLIGGFKPLYTIPESDIKKTEEIEREEK